MSIKSFTKSLANQIVKNLESLDESRVQELVNYIIHADRVFTVGRGRSALVAELFAIRLLQLEFNVSAIGERVLDLAPPIGGKKDVIVAVSGSGETEEVVAYCNAAKKRGALIVAITSFDDSSLAKIADIIIKIKGRTKRWTHKSFLERELEGERESLTKEGSLFELSAMFFFEALIDELNKKLQGA
ncbi:MAG: SIS domain-containing protein [Candidatus Asgardarchaeia archaeon]